MNVITVIDFQIITRSPNMAIPVLNLK